MSSTNSSEAYMIIGAMIGLITSGIIASACYGLHCFKTKGSTLLEVKTFVSDNTNFYVEKGNELYRLVPVVKE